MVSVIGGSRFEVIGKSVRGASHKRADKPCQDSFRIEQAGGALGALVLSVADGHGSPACPYSKSGSAIAVNVFCKTLAERLARHSDDMDLLMAYLAREGDTAIARAVDEEWKRRVVKSYRRRARAASRNGQGGPVGPGEQDGQDGQGGQGGPDEQGGQDGQSGQSGRGGVSPESAEGIWKMFGTTLLGLVVMPPFLFAFQLGDGDMLFVCDDVAKPVISGDKMLGTETRSLSGADAWKKAKSRVCSFPSQDADFAFMLSTDGFANSYRSEALFLRTALEYFQAVQEHGAETVAENLPAWLNETSGKGSGDDITVLIAYSGRGNQAGARQDGNE
jgi:serine/threonine protein phosphatase PrpC